MRGEDGEEGGEVKSVRCKTLRKVRQYVVDGETRTTLVQKVVFEGEERREQEHFAARCLLHLSILHLHLYIHLNLPPPPLHTPILFLPFFAFSRTLNLSIICHLFAAFSLSYFEEWTPVNHFVRKSVPIGTDSPN